MCCGPPLPYLANGSQATSWAQYLDEIGDDLDGDGQGAVDHFGGPIGKAPLKWPRNSENIAVIPYCYFDEKEREAMHEVIEAAIQSWMTYLGNPGKESGHAISFEEWVDSEGKPVICYKKSETDFFHWNPDLPHETLTIQVGKGETGWTANAGLAVDQKSPWRNQLNGPESGRLVNVEWAAMHELGHVMGMAHEHQRSDRDDYIVVKPEKIGDFEECYKRAHEKSSRVTRENVCTSLRVALRNNCACRDWVKGMAELYLPLFTFDKYDPESIMHYPSAIGGKQEKCELYSGEEDTAECPIQQYKNFEDHSQGTTKMTPNLHPSAQDIAWVKKVYAWDDKGEA
ncbi:uncharacterized protein J4E87_009409 [Alternaria ethzedia]|uniref:uncharacterized protein n=1 Tax=Alternaria ethzedia TaxID=181014 RepID=UPI0020C4FF92|nr:uncharacterized protein J4E87_009409 [Alternaria ethzedia]KAI4614609.1 hypothetical protein J4E87_009409 [Alternaria ethzedia]